MTISWLRFFSFLTLFLLSFLNTWGSDRKELLDELDRTIDMRPELMLRKERGITQIKQELAHSRKDDNHSIAPERVALAGIFSI